MRLSHFLRDNTGLVINYEATKREAGGRGSKSSFTPTTMEDGKGFNHTEWEGAHKVLR